MKQADLLPKERRSAVFSDCRQYRYTLEIVWDENKPLVQFIGLNPSTADEFKDDPTIRKCKQFAKNWGYGGMVMTNLFAFRATDPRVMKEHAKPIGEKFTHPRDPDRNEREFNSIKLQETQFRCGLTVAAWGNHGTHLGRDKQVLLFLKNLKCFKITNEGQPQHPLYVPYSTPLIDYTPTVSKGGNVPSVMKPIADVYTMELANNPEAQAMLWRVAPIRSRIATVISEWLNQYGVDAKAEDLDWRDLEERLTSSVAVEKAVFKGHLIGRILANLGHCESCPVIKLDLDNDDDACDCERKSLASEIMDAARASETTTKQESASRHPQFRVTK